MNGFSQQGEIILAATVNQIIDNEAATADMPPMIRVKFIRMVLTYLKQVFVRSCLRQASSTASDQCGTASCFIGIVSYDTLGRERFWAF